MTEIVRDNYQIMKRMRWCLRISIRSVATPVLSIAYMLLSCFQPILGLDYIFSSFCLILGGCFLVADTQLYKRLCPSIGRSVGWSVVIELKSGKTRISAPAHPSATDGRVSGLVKYLFVTRRQMREAEILGVLLLT